MRRNGHEPVPGVPEPRPLAAELAEAIDDARVRIANALWEIGVIDDALGEAAAFVEAQDGGQPGARAPA